MKKLRTSLVQVGLEWEDKQTNLVRLKDRLQALSGQTDLVVLPEMFTTGFSMDPARLAEPLPGPTLEWMRERAAGLDAVVTGSFIATEGKGYYNRLIWMRPDGSWEHYDKRHLFTLAGEQHHYQPGKRRLTIDLKGWKVLPLICYDLRFPVWSRNAEDYDLLIYVANWPARRRHAWRTLLQARAIENQAYTIGVNRVGADGNGVYHSGDSTLVDAGGEALCSLAHEESILTLTLDLEKQREFREKFQFLPDRDIFHIEGVD